MFLVQWGLVLFNSGSIVIRSKLGQDLLDILENNCFLLEKIVSHPLEDVSVFFQYGFNFLAGFKNNILDGQINLPGSLLAEITMLCYLTSKKYLFLFLAVGKRSKLIAHAPFTDHFPCKGCCPFKIIARTGGDFIKDEFFGNAATEQD